MIIPKNLLFSLNFIKLNFKLKTKSKRTYMYNENAISGNMFKKSFIRKLCPCALVPCSLKIKPDLLLNSQLSL